MRQHKLSCALLWVSIFMLDTTAVHAEGDEVCRDAQPPETVIHADGGRDREVLEYGQGSLEWWFKACHSVVVKQFCTDKGFFSGGQGDASDLDERLREEAIWLRVLYQAPLPKLDKLERIEETRVDEAYRFLWRPSFFSPPTVVRVHRSGDKFRYYATQFCWPREKWRDLTKAEWETILGLLEEAKFWALPTFGGHAGLDGGYWLFEGYADKKYHVVDRWSPLGTPLGKLGKYLLELSEFKPHVIH